MTEVWPWLAAIPIAYLLGAIPVGVIVGRIFQGIDVRAYGSGGTGATNVARTAGFRIAGLVLALDIGKGILAVGIARALGDSTIIEALAASFVVAGHSWPVFIGFRGGKGVATGLGALGLISPYAAAATMVAPIVAGITRYVSLGSLLGTLSAIIVLMLQLFVFGYADLGYLVFALFGMLIIVGRHIPNIGRLVRGEEHKFGARVEVKGATVGQQ